VTEDNDYDLDDEEEIIIEDNRNLDFPLDFNVFSSALTDESLLSTHLSPELPSFSSDSPPADELNKNSEKCDKHESPETGDVAEEEKESCLVVEVVLQHQDDKCLNDEFTDETPKETFDDDIITTSVSTEHSADDEKVHPNEISINEEEANSFSDNIPLELDTPKQQENQEADLEKSDFCDFIASIPDDDEEEKADSIQHEDMFIASHITDFPEISELKHDEDEDDDDFNDFETAIPINRHLDQAEPTLSFDNEVNIAPSEIPFEVDFNAFNESTENSFDDFQDFKTADINIENKATVNEINEVEDDDDFGDFSDFTQASASKIEQTAQVEHQMTDMKSTNVNGVINMMFPSETLCSRDQSTTFEVDNSKELKVVNCDSFVTKFNDFDATLALGYLYNSSKASQTLVKALGIDTRNIVS
jgi:hypothetical protein